MTVAVLKKAGAAVLDALFPPRCRWCGGVKGKAPCKKCGNGPKALRLPAAPLAIDRAAGHTHLAELWACWAYKDAVRDALHRYKFEGQRALAGDFAADLAALCTGAGLAGRYDILVPAPVSAKTRRQRGYNQSALLAHGLAGALGLPWEENALVKTKNTPQQMTLNREARLENLKGAFAAGAEELQGRRVLLVDDIVTTGSTLNECAGALLAAGAAGCGAVCVAYTPL